MFQQASQHTQVLLDNVGLFGLGAYLFTLIVVGWLANRASRDHSLRDYYLAGGTLGSVSLFFTLYATQYSGNTLLATPGKAYRSGFDGLVMVVAMMAVMLVYGLFARRLSALSQQHQFVSVGDFIRWRYGHRGLLVLVNIIIVVVLMSYALGNLKAVGLLLESASGGQISFAAGIIGLSLIMGFYESLGGMRGVVWTDILQGSLLFLGCLFVFAAVYSLSDTTSVLRWPEFSQAIEAYLVSEIDLVAMLSFVVLIAFGAAVYPQAIQRIFSARDGDSLMRSYRAMFVMPILTTLPMILIGMRVREMVPDLDARQSEQVVMYAIDSVVTVYPALSWLLILFLAAAIAAIMSTIDSALLTLGSVITLDVLSRDNEVRGAHSRFSGRMTSCVLMALMAAMAIFLPANLWTILVFKMELLVQLAPVIILGVRHERLSSQAIYSGALSGAVFVLVMKSSALFGLTESDSWLGIHTGIWGLMLNLVVMFAVQNFSKQPRSTITSERNTG